jgi:parvulin-like peptidyl-prolyl isomerase
MFDDEDRQQAAVTGIFVLVIAAVLLLLVAAVGIAWYNDNIRPLARVGSTEIGPQLLRDRVEFEAWRIEREQNRLTQASINGDVDEATRSARAALLEQRQENLTTTSLEDLIDLLYQSQLAGEEQIAVSEADIDTAFAKEFNDVEKRHVWAIYINPGAGKSVDDVTNADRRAALARAEEALAALNAGQPFDEVAREFSTDASKLTGGDLGVVSEMAFDEDWSKELFELELNGTTDIFRAPDGTYRIGRVTEIQEVGEQPGLHADLNTQVSDTAIRDFLGKEIAVERLKDKITAAALAQTPEQAEISILYVEGEASGEDPSASEGEIDYSEIVFAPNDDLIEAPDLPAEDPAWEAARVEAQEVYDELIALTAGEVRNERFRAIAEGQSDSETGADGGAVGFVTRDIPPEAVGNALFDSEHPENDLLQPVRGDAAWYVLLFHQRRDSVEQRIQEVKDRLAEPNADFAEIVRDLSDSPDAEEGGLLGWVTRDQLDPDFADKVFALDVGEVSDEIELGAGFYFVKMEKKEQRPYDADQIPDVEANAFQEYYEPKKTAAEDAGTITRADESAAEDPELEAGGD